MNTCCQSYPTPTETADIVVGGAAGLPTTGVLGEGGTEVDGAAGFPTTGVLGEGGTEVGGAADVS